MHTAMSCSATPSRRRSAIRQAAATAALGAVLVGTAALTAAPAMALTFKIGDLDAVVDTTLTASVAMRTQGADERSFIPGVSAPYSGNTQVFPDAGDIYSSPLSALVDLELKKDDYGLFSRVSYT